MKNAVLIVAALISGLPSAAQQAAADAQQATTVVTPHAQADQAAAAQAGRGASSAGLSSAAYAEMRPVSCELAGKLDSKSARIGDSVFAKTSESVRTADGAVIPRGARLVGHITAVQAHASGQADSRISIAFDRAEWSGGHSITIQSVIESVTPPVNAAAAASMGDDDSLGNAMGGGNARGAGGARAGGGLIGGTVGAAGSTAGSLGANAGGALRNAGQLPGSVASGATTSVGSSVDAAAAASMGVHATGIPGVMLAGDASGAASGTFSAAKRNFHLDSGTQLTVAVSAAVSQ